MSDHNLLIINNNTGETLSIYTRGYLSATNELRYVWDIAPSEEDKELWVYDYSFNWELVAKDSQGKIVFSEEITREKLENSGLRRDNHYVYKIDIMVTQKIPEK
jgi:hypothetical protein